MTFLTLEIDVLPVNRVTGLGVVIKLICFMPVRLRMAGAAFGECAEVFRFVAAEQVIVLVTACTGRFLGKTMP